MALLIGKLNTDYSYSGIKLGSGTIEHVIGVTFADSRNDRVSKQTVCKDDRKSEFSSGVAVSGQQFDR